MAAEQAAVIVTLRTSCFIFNISSTLPCGRRLTPFHFTHELALILVSPEFPCLSSITLPDDVLHNKQPSRVTFCPDSQLFFFDIHQTLQLQIYLFYNYVKLGER